MPEKHGNYVKQTKFLGKNPKNELKFLIIHVAWWCSIHVAVITILPELSLVFVQLFNVH